MSVCGSQLGHLSTADQGDEDRCPDECGDDADFQLGAGKYDAACDVGGGQKECSEDGGPGQAPSLVGACGKAGGVGDGQADEREVGCCGGGRAAQGEAGQGGAGG